LRVQFLPHLLFLLECIAAQIVKKVGKESMFKKIQKFIEDVIFEMKKVSWPTWQELKGSTIVVLILSLILSVFLFIVDLILSKLVNVIL
jgi:preprotein translocase subunit SecE